MMPSLNVPDLEPATLVPKNFDNVEGRQLPRSQNYELRQLASGRFSSKADIAYGGGIRTTSERFEGMLRYHTGSPDNYLLIGLLSAPSFRLNGRGLSAGARLVNPPAEMGMNPVAPSTRPTTTLSKTERAVRAF